MNQFDPKIAEAMEHAQKVQKIMTELGHTKYTICGMVSRQMLHDSEQEVSVLLGKLHKVTEQRDDFKKELEIANLRLKGKRHPDDNGIMADGELNVKALLEQRDKLAELSGFGEFDKPTELTATREESDKWEQLAHDKLSEVCRQIEKTRAVTEQRDRLAEALHHLTTHGDYHQPMLRDTVSNIANEALQSLNPDHFTDVSNMIATTQPKYE